MRVAEEPWKPDLPRVDVVVVAYNSAAELRDAVVPLTGVEGFRVIVVDNASSDGSLDRIADLDVTRIARDTNDGFAAGCNTGWRAGRARYVCFLNPDATLDPPGLERLATELDRDPSLGAVAPRIEEEDGSIAWSLRRFPRVRSTFARALFLHRVLPRATWTDDIVRDPRAYSRAWSPDWVSGACVLVRRDALESIGGWDEGFFLYGEDVDLCRRLRGAGWAIRFEPSATACHLGGRSAPAAKLLPVLARSRLRYVRLHRSWVAVSAVRLGLALGAVTHAVLGRPETRRWHLASLRVIAERDREERAVVGNAEDSPPRS